MQGKARGTNKSGGKVPGENRGMQGNVGEYRGMPAELWERVQSARGMLENAGKCQGNVWEWVYNASRMQGTTRGMQGSGCKVLAE